MSDIMTTEVITARENTTLKKLIALIKEKNFKTLPVADSEGVLIGVVTVYDIMKLPELTHGVSVRFFGGAESPEAEKEAFIRRAYARGFLRRGIKLL